MRRAAVHVVVVLLRGLSEKATEVGHPLLVPGAGTAPTGLGEGPCPIGAAGLIPKQLSLGKSQWTETPSLGIPPLKGSLSRFWGRGALWGCPSELLGCAMGSAMPCRGQCQLLGTVGVVHH